MADINGNWEFNTTGSAITTTGHMTYSLYCTSCNCYYPSWQTHVCWKPVLHCCCNNGVDVEAIAQRVVELLAEQKKAKKRAQ